MKKILIVAIVLIACLDLKAQSQIVGKVLELSKNGGITPIFGANVYWEGTNIGTTTNKEGNYNIDPPTVFPANLSVTYVGYTFEKKEIVDDQYIFYLKSSVDLDQVNVDGTINTTKISVIEPLNIQTISSREIQKAACCNLSECFETNNAVDVVYSDAISGIKKIKMLGLSGNYVQITSELMPLVRGFQRPYGLTYIAGSWIESIQIIKGSGSVVNGYEALTGQLNVEYFKPDQDSDKLNWNIFANKSGKLENNLILTKTHGNWKSNLFTHISYFDREVDDNGDNTNKKGDKFLDMPKFKQFSFLNRWKYYGSDEYRFQINLRGTFEDRESGQVTSDIINPYLVKVNNKIVQLYTKFGKIIDSTSSIGSQASFTLHDINAQFGNNIYEGIQESFSFNLISQHQISEARLLKYGSSLIADRFTESFVGNTEKPFDRKKRLDILPGLFAEYQYENTPINIIAGVRADYYNVQKKVYYSPRLNFKYNPSDRTALRFSIGKGFRISNVLVDNMQYLASSRNVIIGENLNPESAWNTGLNFSYCFYFLNNEGTFNIDMYRTSFESQILVDIESKDELIFSNLDGDSYSNAIQIDLDYNIFNNLDLRLSYKKNHSFASFDGIEKELPLSPRDRALINLAYKNIFDKWDFDITANYIGKVRIPENIMIMDKFSSSFLLFNSQLTYKWNHGDIYVGAENITNYIQSNPIIDAANPFGDDFDASLIWAPIMGRAIYIGFRYAIKQ